MYGNAEAAHVTPANMKPSTKAEELAPA